MPADLAGGHADRSIGQRMRECAPALVFNVDDFAMREHASSAYERSSRKGHPAIRHRCSWKVTSQLQRCIRRRSSDRLTESGSSIFGAASMGGMLRLLCEEVVDERCSGKDGLTAGVAHSLMGKVEHSASNQIPAADEHRNNDH